MTLSTLLLATFLLLQEPGEPRLRISSPAAGAPLFGHVDITVEIDGDLTVEAVEFFVDGVPSGSVTKPPYEIGVDVGQQNESHYLFVKAIHDDGELTATLVSPIFRVDQEITTELRQLYVTVVQYGHRVLNLTRSDLTIFDQNTPQEIVTFSRGNVRLQAAILVDSSTSMKDGGLGFALRGAREFMEGLRPQDEASVMLFSDRLLWGTAFSSDPRVVFEGLSDIEAGGGTALSDHLYMGLKLLEKRLGRRVLVLLSDGVDSHSALGMNDVSWLAKRSGSMIYWIRTGLSSAESSRYSAWKGPDVYDRERRLLERIVKESGGRIVPLERMEDADKALQEVLQELREQYVLGYYPTNVRKDGKWHRVQIGVDRVDALARARYGYIDL